MGDASKTAPDTKPWPTRGEPGPRPPHQVRTPAFEGRNVRRRDGPDSRAGGPIGRRVPRAACTRTRKGRPPPRGPAAFLLRENAGGARKRKGGPPRVPPSQAPRSRIPAPSPAQRAPGAGGALVSHRVAPAVPSALAGLTSGFGMGPGVPRPPGPPAPGGRCGAGCRGAGRRSGRPGGRTALVEGAL